MFTCEAKHRSIIRRCSMFICVRRPQACGCTATIRSLRQHEMRSKIKVKQFKQRCIALIACWCWFKHKRKHTKERWRRCVGIFDSRYLSTFLTQQCTQVIHIWLLSHRRSFVQLRLSSPHSVEIVVEIYRPWRTLDKTDNVRRICLFSREDMVSTRRRNCPGHHRLVLGTERR